MRIKCQVLQVIAAKGPCSSLDVQQELPHLENEQVQKAIYNMLQQDRIFKADQVERIGSNGRPMFLYEVRENWEPQKTTGMKSGRTNYAEKLRSGHAHVGLADIAIKFRDKKIRLLQSLIKYTGDMERDLLIGILNDYGYKHHA